MIDPLDAWQTKRDGGALSAEDCQSFIAATVDGRLDDARVTAMLAVIFVRGMQPAELVAWTDAMLNSGDRLSWHDLDGPIVDKHSTGGVGDKASLPLAPALAACGLNVPMISGRGLGHTGGTLDKLESIPGMRTELERDQIESVLRTHGAVFAAQTDRLVPADKRLYALRDVTGLVESLPLIASSIMSKKLAEGIEALVLDVKFGSGAFLADPVAGEQLGRAMLDIASGFGVATTVVQTSMEQPLGRAVGHALEVRESIECLRGEGPADLRQLVCRLGGELLVSVKQCPDLEAGQARIAQALDDGTAFDKFVGIVAAQGGDAAAVHEPDRLPAATGRHALRAGADGVLRVENCRSIGLACAALGGGRAQLTDQIDPAVGIVFAREVGSTLTAGEVWAEVHHSNGHGLDQAVRVLESGVRIGEPFERAPLVRASFHTSPPLR
ncbi:MAG: pyrimidine-nucleoside phosphorylase [Planctomycetota bacterium]|jgi:pyrimidine-nucleoside phosphorylase